MEFSIQKIRRCGKSALRSHRREAARVVFFTIFLPFLLLLLLGVNLYHNIPGTFIGQNEKAVWIFAGIAAVRRNRRRLSCCPDCRSQTAQKRVPSP